jgi:Ca-activated chloride channel family protein
MAPRRSKHILSAWVVTGLILMGASCKAREAPRAHAETPPPPPIPQAPAAAGGPASAVAGAKPSLSDAPVQMALMEADELKSLGYTGRARGTITGAAGTYGLPGGVAGYAMANAHSAVTRRKGVALDKADFGAAEANTEAYAAIDENPFLAVASHPLSTFSVDVDRASYSNVRRFLNEGKLPPRDAVRIEELINYFAYDYPEPSGKDPFSVTTEVAPAPWNPRHALVKIGLKGKSVDLADMPPGNLVFLIDVSGSMNEPMKLPLLKEAFAMLVDQLRPQDRVAIVVYAGNAGLVLPSTPGSEKGKILDALASLEAGGSTAGGEGIRLAYKVAAENRIEGGNNRVILATDGDFNVGVSSDAEMVRLIEEKRKQGAFLTVLGFGEGNLQDTKMEQIADKGNGHYAYIDSALEARKVLVGELGGTLLTIAKDVKLQIEFNPEKVASYRLIGYENRLLRNEDFNNDAKDAGDIGAGHTVTALYELVPVGVDDESVKTGTVDPLRYRKGPADAGDPARAGDPAGVAATAAAAAGLAPAAAHGNEMLFVKLRYKDPDGETSRLVERAVMDESAATPSEDFRFAAAVAEFGLLLRESEHKGSATFEDVRTAAVRACARDREGYRTEFVKLVDVARTLSAQKIAAGHD